MRSPTMLGLDLPSSSTKSRLRPPALKASIALSSDMCSAEFLMRLHLCKYALTVSPLFWVHAFNCSIDAGFLHVDLKFWMNTLSKLSQLSMDPSGNFLIHDLAAPL